jgi:putative oxidoreductase
MQYLFLVGRLLYGGFFLLAGLDHFRRSAALTGYASAKGIPAPKLAVLVSGLAIIGGGLSMILGARPSWGVLLLAIFLIPVSLLVHNFWAVEDPQARQVDTVQFKKNVALLGAALMFLLIPQPWPLSLDW